MNRLQHSILLTPIVCASILRSFAVDPDDRFTYWPTDLKIGGTVIACSAGGIDPQIPKTFRAAAGGAEAKVVVIDLRMERDPGLSDLFSGGASKVETLLPPAGRPPAAPPPSLASATGILLLSATAPGDGELAWLSTLAASFDARIQVGATLCAVGPVVSTLGKHLIGAEPTAGMNLIPDTIIAPDHGDKGSRETLLGALRNNSLCVGIGIPNDTAIVLKSRKIRVFGKGSATFMLAGDRQREERIETRRPAATRGSNPYETIADLTAWRRDAMERQLPPFPAEEPPIPDVKNGHLIIVGGGGMPRGLMERMVEMAGGKDARLIYVPCTEAEQVAPDSGPIRQWKELGVRSATVLHTKNRLQANSDEAFLAPLKDATGIWFGGGRQWNLADSYFGTRAHDLMQAVLDRGGVIGGSSAGASIQADYLARANPVANFDIMAPGYERGLGFIEGVAVDQHFSQRGRQKDMSQLVARYPQILGIGIDEATALVVNRSQAEVVGRGEVYFYDRRVPTAEGAPDFNAYGEGTIFDLAKRKAHRR